MLLLNLVHIVFLFDEGFSFR